MALVVTIREFIEYFQLLIHSIVSYCKDFLRLFGTSAWADIGVSMLH